MQVRSQILIVQVFGTNCHSERNEVKRRILTPKEQDQPTRCYNTDNIEILRCAQDDRRWGFFQQKSVRLSTSLIPPAAGRDDKMPAVEMKSTPGESGALSASKG